MSSRGRALLLGVRRRTPRHLEGHPAVRGPRASAARRTALVPASRSGGVLGALEPTPKEASGVRVELGRPVGRVREGSLTA